MIEKNISSKIIDVCKICSEVYEVESWWENYGTYSAKLKKCPHCGKISVIKYEEASGLYINTDKRYYI